MSEFSIIKKYFENFGCQQKDVVLGIGDDAALVKSTGLMAISVDTFSEDIHFPKDTSAYDIGWKALAINLSDMAAMGAKPCWMTLAITLPSVDHEWLTEFSRGLSTIAEEYNVALIGGDTTKGSLSITLQIFGRLTDGNALCRNSAKPGDLIYVTGIIGDGALGLKSLQQNVDLSSTEKNKVQLKLNRPDPRVKEMLELKNLVNSAIDISDGLTADLSHILKSSQVGAIVRVKDIPVSQEYRWCCQGSQAYDLALTGGDDYEICMTVSADNEDLFLKTANNNKIEITKIGEITKEKDFRLLITDNTPYTCIASSFEHFN